MLWIRLNSCQLLDLSTQLDKTNLAPINKQCLIMFRLCCKKLVLAIKENTEAKHAQLKVSESFLIPSCYQFYW